MTEDTTKKPSGAEVARAKHASGERAKKPARDRAADLPVGMRVTDEPAAMQKPPRWRFGREYVGDILAHADDPRAPITLGRETLVEIEPGGILVLIAASKRGKTSLACCALIEHARDRGPAVACSLELPGRQLVARAIGTRREASWRDVLAGKLGADDMMAALPERFAVIDRDVDDPLAALREAIAELRVAHPGEPLLVAVDYIQLVPTNERDMRARTDAAMKALAELATETGAVMIALSQSSRADSRALAAGQKRGAEAADTGAESAAIERWASGLVVIGKAGPAGDDGARIVALEIASQRMAEGDRTQAARYDGRSGRWSLVGEARPVAEARAEDDAAAHAKELETVKLAISALLAKSDKPMGRADIRAAIAMKVRGEHKTAAMNALLADAGSGIVECGAKISRGGFPLWTKERAVAVGMGVHTRHEPSVSESSPSMSEPVRTDSVSESVSVSQPYKGGTRTHSTQAEGNVLSGAPTGKGSLAEPAEAATHGGTP